MKRHADPARVQTPRSLMSSSSSSSSWSTVSASMSSPSSSSSDGVSSYEADAAPALLIFDCNLPELLARDLVISKDIFASKAMTAGPPDMGLAAQDREYGGLLFQRPILPYRERETPRRPPSRINTCLSYSPVLEEEPDSDGNDSFQHEEHSGKITGFRGVPTATKSTCPAPRSIPTTRRQSVATAATPVHGHCSPGFSHHITRPTSPVPSPSSSNREGSSHGTWFEDEPDSPLDNEPTSSVGTARSSISDSHHANMDYGDPSGEMKPPSRGQTASAHEAPELSFIGSHYGTPSRPQTPAGPARSHSKKPRIVDIPPVIAGPKRSSSLRWNRHGTDSLSKPPDHDGFLTSEAVSRERQSAARSADAHLQRDNQADLPLLETANGRTVIDASSPPPIAFAHNGHAHQASSSPVLNEDENLDDYDDDDDNENHYPNIFASPPRRSHADIHHWVDTSAKPHTPSAPPHVSHGIPLPPEVIESLRVSISCFPETMLQTSNLSVETIRTYSKKIKHRADLGRHLRNTDADSIYSFASSQHPKPSKRWNMNWWRSNHHNQNRPQQSQHQQDPFSRDMPSHLGTTPNLAFSTAARRGPPVWKPIKNVFPSAPDKLCDALYAHLLVYNYLTLLSPQPATSTTTTILRSATAPGTTPFAPPPTNTTTAIPRPPTPYFNPEQSQSRPYNSNRPRSTENPATAGLKIPQKAASLLGMEDTFPPPMGNRDFGSPQAARRGVLVRGRRPLQREQEKHEQKQGQAEKQKQADYLSKELPATPSRESSSTTHSQVAHLSQVGSDSRTNNGHRNSSSAAIPSTAAAAVAMRKELLAGLERCITLLLSVMKTHHATNPTSGNYSTRTGLDHAESASLFGSEFGFGGLGSLGKKVKGALGGRGRGRKGDGGESGDYADEEREEDGEEVVGGALMRALCEVVRCAEDGVTS